MKKLKSVAGSIAFHKSHTVSLPQCINIEAATPPLSDSQALESLWTSLKSGQKIQAAILM